jgi:hypothetical protein
MTHPSTVLAAATVSVAILCAAAPLARADQAPDSQWRASSLTLSTLLQDGYKIVAMMNATHSNAGPADVILVQRDQSAYKCFDPAQSDAKTKSPGAAPACFELVQPSGVSEAK